MKGCSLPSTPRSEESNNPPYTVFGLAKHTQVESAEAKNTTLLFYFQNERRTCHANLVFVAWVAGESLARPILL